MKKIKLFGLAALMAVGLTACGTSADEKIAKSAVDVISVPNQISSYEHQLPALIQVTSGNEKVSVEVKWEGLPAERWEFRYETTTCFATITLPDANKDEDAVEFTLKATGTYNGATATREFTGYLMPSTVSSNDETMTVAEAIAAEDGEVVTVKGITAPARDGDKGFYIVDKTAAMYVYDPKAKAINNFAYGNEVQITATRSTLKLDYRENSAQLTFGDDSTLSLKSSEVKPIPTDSAINLTCTEFTGWKKDGTEDYSGKLFKLTAKLAMYNPGSYTNYEAIDDSGKYIQFYAKDGSVYATEFAEFFAGDTTVSSDGKTTSTVANYNIYLSVYDAQVSNGAITKWRVCPLLVVAA